MAKSEKKSTILIVSLSISILLNFFLGYHAYQLNTNYTALNDKYAQTTDEKSQVENELTSMLESYNQLETSNEELNRELTIEKEKITKLLQQLKNEKWNNKQEIDRYKKEVETLRKIMRSYVVQIDSLNTKNQKLQAENQQVKNQYEQVITEKEDLIGQKDSLTNQVEIAATILAQAINFEALNKRGRKTTRIAKTEKFSVCFALGENKIASTGTKTVYVRIAKPDGQILIHSLDNLFDHNGSQIAYSAKRQVNYDGTETNTCIFYTHKSSEGTLPVGTYVADIFVDGKKIGTQNLLVD